MASQFSSYLLDIINVYNQDLFVLQEVLKQLQSKLEQEAGTLASSGRSDILHQLKGLHLPQGIPFCCNESARDGIFIIDSLITFNSSLSLTKEALLHGRVVVSSCNVL